MRNKFFEYDQISEKSTNSVDDESDHFKSNSVWLSDSERKKLTELDWMKCKPKGMPVECREKLRLTLVAERLSTNENNELTFGILYLPLVSTTLQIVVNIKRTPRFELIFLQIGGVSALLRASHLVFG